MKHVYEIAKIKMLDVPNVQEEQVGNTCNAYGLVDRVLTSSFTPDVQDNRRQREKHGPSHRSLKHTAPQLRSLRFVLIPLNQR